MSTQSLPHSQSEHSLPPDSSHEGTLKKSKEKGKGSEQSDEAPTTSSSSTREALYGAVVRALVVLFARPVRLFRPVKVTSLQLLESLAKREGRTLSFRYLWKVLRREKWSFLPHLLGPPLIYQTLVGFSLFSVYTLTESSLVKRRERKQQLHLAQTEQNQPTPPPPPPPPEKPIHATFTPLTIVIASGASAGIAQCILSAPLDNVRFILENGQPNSAKQHPHQTSAQQLVHRDLSSRRRRRLFAPRLGAGHLNTAAAAASNLQVSWRAVAKAALLPFLPTQTHSRVAKQVIEQGKKLAESTLEGATEEAAKKRKEVWQQTLKAWRGGLHGSGLIMSLCRDSVGFAAFFAVFELSRRCAYHSSMAFDRFSAWINTTIPLLRFGSPQPQSSSQPQLVHDHPVRGKGKLEDGEVFIESSSSTQARSHYFSADSEIQPDISYNSTRTVPGRMVAVLVLVTGGAVGATLYELVGRPFELMRLVIFTGTRAWEKEVERRRASAAARQRAYGRDAGSTSGAPSAHRGRSTASSSSSLSSTTSTGVRAASPDRLQHGRTALRGARVRASQNDLLFQNPNQRRLGIGLFLTLRSANTMGSTSSRVSSSLLNARRRAGHPLTLSKTKTQASKAKQAKVKLSQERRSAKISALSKSGAHRHLLSSHGRSSASTPMPSPQRRTLVDPDGDGIDLPTRPSAARLLIAHAKHTDPGFMRDMLLRFPRPIALLALCGKAYFVGPFVANAGGPDTYLGALKADERKARDRKAQLDKARSAATAAAAAASSSSSAGASSAKAPGPASSSLASSSSGAAPNSVIWRIQHQSTHAWQGALRWTNVAWESRWGWALRKVSLHKIK
ncbi:hypothetical protein OC846_006525 [Tilletia horrida]|uniref:Mitochondrial carrier n=1 Tax=Tilletia horrida TaxID=155126 RepID=A0AAN6JNX7_9BASI|nr:hypothetical protein OC845_006472 [Tilletia horrida]KAK0543122.1 hypothetical protein OC846_006525 [Tilletia horrida]